MNSALDIEAHRAWIGREESAEDIITPSLVKRYHATCDLPEVEPRVGDDVAPGLHWCLAPSIYPNTMLGPDGHPTRGGFLPPIPLPRRMWAGGEWLSHGALRVGDLVKRVSRIEDVTFKQGRTGPLYFVAVRHEMSVGGELAVSERHDIVYREAEPAAMLATTPARAASFPPPRWTRSVDSAETRLFRYSALTFNSHRIHYDRRYVTEEEGYPGLVVHGPLQATMLLLFAREIRGVAPTRFTFRIGSPIFDGANFSINADEDGAGLKLWTADAAGRSAMVGQASF